MKHIVHIIESEAGWGSRIDDVMQFDDKLSAEQFVKEYNDEYITEDTVPDWYMVAQYVGIKK